jgi:membrane protein insertase Oxa1/YidC/SpoIIIJ
MNLFSIDNLSIEEVSALRQSLNVIDIKGSSAQFIANLQIKLDHELEEIQKLLREEEQKKQEGIKKIEKVTKLNP